MFSTIEFGESECTHPVSSVLMDRLEDNNKIYFFILRKLLSDCLTDEMLCVLCEVDFAYILVRGKICCEVARLAQRNTNHRFSLDSSKWSEQEYKTVQFVIK